MRYFNHFLEKIYFINYVRSIKTGFPPPASLKSLIFILSLSVILYFWGKLTLFDEKCRIWKRFLLCLINHNCNNSWLNGLLNLILRDCWFERSHPGFKNLSNPPWKMYLQSLNTKIALLVLILYLSGYISMIILIN